MSNETPKKTQSFWESIIDFIKSLFGISKKKKPIGPAIKLEPIKIRTLQATFAEPEKKEELREIKIQEEKKPFYDLKPLVLGKLNPSPEKKIEKIETPKKPDETKQDQQPPKKTNISEGPSGSSSSKSASSAKKAAPKKKK